MAPKKKGRMKRLADGIYQRDGRILVKWWQPNGGGKGTRLQKTMPPGTTLAEAKVFKGKMEDEKLRKRVRREETVDAFAERWADDYPRQSDVTNMYNRERVRKLGKDFKGRKLSSVTREEARKWALANQGHAKAAAAMFRDAQEDGYLGDQLSPFRALKLPRARGRQGDAITLLTEKEVYRLTRIAHNLFGDFGPVMAGMIAMAAWTGMRPGELYALEWGDIDFERKTITVWRQYLSKVGRIGELKTESGRRTIALLPQAEKALREIPRHPSEQWVFYTKTGARFSSRVHHYYWDPVRKAFWNELKPERQERIRADFDWYELRHLYGSYLANTLRATPYVIAQQMGHADGGRLAMKLYIHTDADSAVADVLAAAAGLGENVAPLRKRATG